MTKNLTPKANAAFRLGDWMDMASRKALFEKLAVVWWCDNVMAENMEADGQYAEEHPDEKLGNATMSGIDGYSMAVGAVLFGAVTPFQIAVKYGLRGGGKALKAMAKPPELKP